MNNFIYQCPTKMIFGKDQIQSLATQLDKSEKILLLYGGGSIKKNGVYDAVLAQLSGFSYVEFGGVEANPQFDTCVRAAKLAREQNATLILAVGGGSVADAAKFIAQIYFYAGQEERIYDRLLTPQKAISLACVMTLPATGSEMNKGCVISRASTKDKRGFHNELVYPRFSIVDPTFTFSLPARQIVNGIVDSFVHALEQYASFDVDSPLQDFWAIGVMRTLLLEGKKTLDEPTNYEARANLCWASTCALNGFISVGVEEDWAIHAIGHELTAFYGIDHAQSLAAVFGARYRYALGAKAQKLAKLGREAFGLVGDDDLTLASECVDKIEAFFNSLGMATSLSGYGIDAKEAAKKVSEHFMANDTRRGERGAEVGAKEAFDIVMSAV